MRSATLRRPADTERVPWPEPTGNAALSSSQSGDIFIIATRADDNTLIEVGGEPLLAARIVEAVADVLEALAFSAENLGFKCTSQRFLQSSTPAGDLLDINALIGDFNLKLESRGFTDIDSNT